MFFLSLKYWKRDSRNGKKVIKSAFIDKTDKKRFVAVQVRLK